MLWRSGVVVAMHLSTASSSPGHASSARLPLSDTYAVACLGLSSTYVSEGAGPWMAPPCTKTR